MKGISHSVRLQRRLHSPMETSPGLWWYIAFVISSVAALFGGYAIYITVYKGIGTWGVNNSVAWGWEIVNFVWWIGIGHAGTAFSIFLLILRQKWRTSINRAAEAMTVFAVMCAALFPALHMGQNMGCFLYISLPEYTWPFMGEFQFPAFLGFYSHYSIPSDFSFILVSWNVTRSWHNT